MSKHSLGGAPSIPNPTGLDLEETAPTSQLGTSIPQQTLLFSLPSARVFGVSLLIPPLPGQLFGSTAKLTWPNGKSQGMHPAYCYQNGMLGML